MLVACRGKSPPSFSSRPESAGGQEDTRCTSAELGAIALGLGAADGMLLPPTPREREMLGGVSEALVGRTQEVAQTAQRLLHVAEQMKDTAKEGLEAAQKELTEPESKAS